MNKWEKAKLRIYGFSKPEVVPANDGFSRLPDGLRMEFQNGYNNSTTGSDKKYILSKMNWFVHDTVSPIQAAL